MKSLNGVISSAAAGRLLPPGDNITYHAVLFISTRRDAHFAPTLLRSVLLSHNDACLEMVSPFNHP